MRGLIFSRQKIRILTTILAILLVVGGGVFLLWPRTYSAWQRHEGSKNNAAQLQQATRQLQPDTPPSMQLGTPVSLSLPRLSVTLGVKTGVYVADSQSWTIDRTHAFFMQGSGEVSAPKTPIIYGHDIPAVFMSLSGVAPQEMLRITNDAGVTLLFAYRGDTTVDPYDASVRETVQPNTVFLMTCSGAHFEHRRILAFSYMGVVS